MDALAKSLVRTVVLKIGLIGNFSTYQKENDHPAHLILKKTDNVVSNGIFKKLGGGFWWYPSLSPSLRI
jgi:hypothetical protein